LFLDSNGIFDDAGQVSDRENKGQHANENLSHGIDCYIFTTDL